MSKTILHLFPNDETSRNDRGFEKPSQKTKRKTRRPVFSA